MANKLEKIAENKKRLALAKQEKEVDHFAKRVAQEVIGGFDGVRYEEIQATIAELATSIATAVVLSNEPYDRSLNDNFTSLLSAVKENKPDNSTQLELSKQIGRSLAKLETTIEQLELAPTINVEGLSREDLAGEVDKIVSRIPETSKRAVTIEYENATADKYINVRLTDGIKFYSAFSSGGGRGGGGTLNGATTIKQDEIVSELQTLNSLVPSTYDYIDLSYTGDNLTGVVFKSGGAGGTIISTLTLAYSGDNLTSVTKT